MTSGTADDAAQLLGSHPRGPRQREADYAARWRDGEWLSQTFTTFDGLRYTLLYQGRPGTGSGPDFRDAVLLAADGERVCGDIELHLRPGNWRAHGHQRDTRYNGVILHVVVARGASHEQATLRANGTLAPLTVLPDDDGLPRPRRRVWPCQELARAASPRDVRTLLLALGEARLHERAVNFSALLRQPAMTAANAPRWSHADVVLWLALAEALGYGRDRDGMRDAALRLMTFPLSSWERGSGGEVSRLDAQRERGLENWFTRWRSDGAWDALERVLRAGDERAAGAALARALAVAAVDTISPSRAAIVVANVALPFALTRADQTDDHELARRVHAVYATLPGLPSNTITRLLTRQFGLARLPGGAQAQQGLHHVWARWCREKRCETCPLAALASGIKTATTVGS
jgi:hypothetical protein